MRPYQPEPAGLYVHIPFCIRKCPYCDFYSITDLSFKHAFINALMREMQMEAGFFQKTRFFFDTLYIGGGTPSVFDAEDIGQIIETARNAFPILPDAEITIEVNPGTVTPEKLRGYYRAGVSRINIGVQSFQEENLRFLGRIHSAEEAHLAIQWARKAGFDNIGLDFIYGLPGQTELSWIPDLERAVESEPAHLSCYMLTYEEGTAMDKDRRKGCFVPLSEGRVADLFQTTVDFLSKQGYAQYEISNFARSGPERSRHNQKYWQDVPYLGFGPSAHSYVSPCRYWNHRSVKKYLSDIGAGRFPIAEKEILTREQQITEAIYLGLRTTDGIDIEKFDEKFGVSFHEMFGEMTDCFEENGLIKTDEKRCALTRRGMLFLDSVVSALV
ncbi:radical SAM family heme chaperone HemW [Desulfonema magnum]|uniref:Heme chaperone HemW n=1 Tax=Desulfonema magnum TaxID=45655 RepID=A0A975GT68_9BACT|nr:radical SAM family heme chaperone HemW [Desulfonema magnum]QTA92682.1 Heme chaperone [Desulfonema magnum]